MNTSAVSIPASIRPATPSPAPTVKRPPASSQLMDWSLSSRSWDSGSLSSTETSCPASSARLATADPTRPAPTIRMKMPGTLGAWSQKWRATDLMRPSRGVIGGVSRRRRQRGGGDHQRERHDPDHDAHLAGGHRLAEYDRAGSDRRQVGGGAPEGGDQ